MGLTPQAALYGTGVSAIVINDIRTPSWKFLTQVFLCIDLLASFPIVFNASAQLFEGNKGNGAGATGERTSFSMPRVLLFALTLSVALRESFVSIVILVGGFSQTTLALVLPSLMYLYSGGSHTLGVAGRAFEVAVACIGIMLVVLTTTIGLSTGV